MQKKIKHLISAKYSTIQKRKESSTEEIICGNTVNGGEYHFVKNRYGKDLAVQLVDCCSPFPIGLELTRQLLTKREMSKFLKYVMATTCCLLQRVDLHFHFEFRIRQHWHNEIKSFLKSQHNCKINNVISKMISRYCDSYRNPMMLARLPLSRFPSYQ